MAKQFTLAEFKTLTEKQWLNQVVELARLLGWSTYHPWLSIHSASGWPDLALVRERLILAELKAEKGKVSIDQRLWLDRLIVAGVESYVWRPSQFDEVVSILTRRGNEEKEDSEVQVVEEAGIAFNPETQVLDLSKEEKRRTTALMMAIQAYDKLIIKEAEYLRQATDNARREEGPKLQPATIDAMIDAAWKFDVFISGGYHTAVKEESDARSLEGIQIQDPSTHR